MATLNITTLTEDDVVALREMAARQRSAINNTVNRPAVDPVVSQSSEVLIAFTPAGGIPALTDTDVPQPGYTGTGSGTHEEFLPPFAFCDIYRVILTDTGITEIAPVFFQEQLYNLGTSTIPANTWVGAVQDRFGTWLAVPFQGASGGSITIEDQHGAGAIPGVTVIQLDSASGATFTNEGGGTVLVSLLAATPLQDGVITTTTQQFIGLKSFETSIEVWDKLYTCTSFGTRYGYVDGSQGIHGTVNIHSISAIGVVENTISLNNTGINLVTGPYSIGGVPGINVVDPVGNVFSGGILITAGPTLPSGVPFVKIAKWGFCR